MLDIGSGNQPCRFATVLADMNVDDNRQRSDHGLKRDDRPFYQCNVESLPFKDKQFDYVIASHVMEHVNDPRKACMELQRVARKGYIETPSPFLEQGYWVATDGKSHWEWHQWYAWNPSQSVHAAHTREIGKKLIFQREDPKQFDDSVRHSHLMRLMMQDIRAHFSKDGTNNDYVNKIMAMFTPNTHATILHWQDSFEVEVWR